MNIKVRVREHEYKILKDCFDEIAPDLNLSLVSVEEAYRAPGDDDCESNSTHIIQLETTKERWNEIMDYCLSLEKDVFDENDRRSSSLRTARNTPATRSLTVCGALCST